MAELSIELSAKIDKLRSGIKEAEDLLKGVETTAKKSSDALDDSFKGIKTDNAAFRSIDELTGGIAGNAVDIANGFKGASAGANAFKLALIGTGIGALVVAVGALAVYWDDIESFVKGVNRELARKRDIQQDIVDSANQEVDLLNAQLATLELQGKSDKEINALKRERLKVLLNEKKQLLDIAKTQLENLVESEKRSREVLLKLTSLSVTTAATIAKAFDGLLGTNFEKDIGDVYKSALDFLAGDDSKEAQKEINKLSLELVKLQNSIDKTKLDDIKIDLKNKKETDPFYTDKELANLFGVSDEAQKKLEDKAAKTSSRISKAIAKELDASPMRAYASEIENILTEFNENANQIIEGSIVNTFAGIGSAIGNALSESENIGQALAKALLSSIGAMLIQLGELAISTGVGILAINLALQSLNPYVAIAAGIALVALGSAVSNSASKIGSSGGTSSGVNSVSGQGSSSNSFSGGSSSRTSSSSGGEYIFRIRGRELIGVIENELSASKRLGGIGTLGG